MPLQESDVILSYHLTRWQARCVRKRWISVPGRDAYVRRLGRLRWECRRIYMETRADRLQESA